MPFFCLINRLNIQGLGVCLIITVNLKMKFTVLPRSEIIMVLNLKE